MSFLFGSTAKLPSAPPSPLGVNPKRLSTSETAVPVPLWHGSARFGVSFISDIFEVRTVAVVSSAGKQDTVSGYNYYASFAALIGHGIIKRIRSLWFNGEKVWTGPTNIVGDYLDLTIAGYGLVRIYAGTETQTPDAYLIGKSGVDHPAYRGLAYMVFTQLFFGFNQTNAPNIEVWADRYYRSTWSGYGPISKDENPVNIFADWWSNPRAGLGLPDDNLDTDALNATAGVLNTHAIGLSPVIDTAQEMRQSLTQLLEYFDGFAIVDNGLFSLDLAQPPADIAALLVVDQTMMTRKPELAPEDWSSDTLFSETYVKFSNEETDLKEDAVSWRDGGLVAITGEPSGQTLERDWVTRVAVAQAIANTAGRASAVPPFTGTLYLLSTHHALRTTLVPGTLFALTYTPRHITGLICRCTERTIISPGASEFSISFRIDRSYLFNESVASIGSQHVPKSAPPPSPAEPIESAAPTDIIELPLALCPEGILSLALLARRPTVDTQGYIIYLLKDFTGDWGGDTGTDSYLQLDRHNRFVQIGTLLEDYPDVSSTGTIDIAIGVSVQLTGIDTTLDEQTPFDALADTLLLIVEDEWLSIHRVELVASGMYRLYGIRARMATASSAHPTGSTIYIARKEDLQPLQHPSFQSHNTATFKVTPFNGSATLDLSDATAIPLTITGNIYAAPPPTNLQAFGSQAPTYTTGQDIPLTWTLTDAGRDRYQAELLSQTTVLDIYDGVTLKGTIIIGTGATSTTITNAALVALLGSEITFAVKARTRLTFDWSTNESAEAVLTVTKI